MPPLVHLINETYAATACLVFEKYGLLGQDLSYKKYVEVLADPSWESRGAGGDEVFPDVTWCLRLGVEKGEHVQ